MPRRGVVEPKRLWSDGIHYVRAASHKDTHEWRFVIAAHQSNASPFFRHMQDKESAIARAREATKAWLKRNPKDRPHWTEAAEPQASTSQEPVIKLQPFSTTQFNCIYANPVAQVWQRVSADVERKTPGRRRASGHIAEATPVFHVPGQCAVLIGDAPHRLPDGTVAIFHNWSQAAEVAQELYDSADEEDRLFWREGDKKVYATRSVDVIFDPEINGIYKPFSLYLPEYRRPVYEDRTRAIPGTELPRSKIDALINPQAKLDEQERRRKHQALNREPAFEEKPLRFRTIAKAITEAERRERMLKGLPVV